MYNFYIVKIIPNTDLTKNLNSGKTGEVKMKVVKGHRFYLTLKLTS